ncbi:transposase [Faecalicatena contorta]|nr:transposase [Faecalicatena contorta]
MIVDKALITKVCVDDFAFRKRYSYGSVMVDIETHRILDIIDSRETKQVEKWLGSYPNLQVVSRDGARTYSSATSHSHPDALQVSDRFHLLKNLSEAAEKYMRRLFPSRLVIPATSKSQSAEMQALYNTRNRSERILFAQQKRKEGYTINDIALLLHSSVTTISKYLSIPEAEIPKAKGNAREIQHIQQMEKKKMAIQEVRTWYHLGHSVDEITRLTGHTLLTVNNYLKDNCSLSNGHYDDKSTLESLLLMSRK